MNGFFQRFRRHEYGAVTVEWVVLSALAVGLLAAGYTSMYDGATALATSNQTYMSTFR